MQQKKHTNYDLRPDQVWGAYGYAIIESVMPAAKVDAVVDEYENVVKRYDKPLTRQNHAIEPHRFTEFGGLINTIVQPHCLQPPELQRFSTLVLELLADPGLHDALRVVAGHPSFRLAQTMFFDHTTTSPHQDWVYLDTLPNGYLIAAWIALEDIHEDGIRFFVVPGSQNLRPTVGPEDWDEYQAQIEQYTASSRDGRYGPSLRKGDVFFWSSRTIHGSHVGPNRQRRRRSVTAHFIPEGFAYGKLGGTHDFNPATYKGLVYNLFT